MIRITKVKYDFLSFAVNQYDATIFIGKETKKIKLEYFFLQKQFKELKEYEAPFNEAKNLLIIFTTRKQLKKTLLFIDEDLHNENNLKNTLEYWFKIISNAGFRTIAVNIVSDELLHNINNEEEFNTVKTNRSNRISKIIKNYCSNNELINKYLITSTENRRFKKENTE